MEELQQSYKSLDEIRMSKESVLDEIRGDSDKVKELWSSLFNKEETRANSTSQRLVKAASMSAGIFDGIMLGWKLYRKFGGYRRSRR